MKIRSKALFLSIVLLLCYTLLIPNALAQPKMNTTLALNHSHSDHVDAEKIDADELLRFQNKYCPNCLLYSLESYCKKDTTVYSRNTHTYLGVTCTMTEMRAGAYYKCYLCNYYDYTSILGRHLCLVVHSDCSQYPNGIHDWCECTYS